MKVKQRIQAVGAVFFLLLLAGCGQQTEMWKTAEEREADNTAAVQPGTEEEGGIKENRDTEIYVYVCGYVKNPGVYRLPQDARICDALEQAGGVLAEGNPEGLNQAERVTDGQTVYVSSAEREEEDMQQALETDGRVNINLAGVEELMTLPGIGEAKALTILEYRTEHGSFNAIEDLMTIPGIKEGVFNKIRDRIKV
ncbi:MAG: ComEA family DNA-binding protein [Bacteroidales bacterium]|nr:ComEA family DNA-binding protein [Clostridium sp.]MCM1202563.1 ComEA family DNA-binding protein [Bacteroidales bacterium]